MECKADSVHAIGDHNVWYGNIYDAHIDDNVSHPMLYQSRYMTVYWIIQIIIARVTTHFAKLLIIILLPHLRKNFKLQPIVTERCN
jgi:flavin reductase (DIM6/NTAB) family NADH-FMN oxidoreductase RutF